MDWFGIGQIAAAIGQTALNAKSLEQQEKMTKKATKLAKKAQKIAEEDIRPQRVDRRKTALENIDNTALALEKLEPIVQREMEFNKDTARGLNEFVQQEMQKYLPGQKDLIAEAARNIAINLTGDLTTAEKAALLETARASAEQAGLTYGLVDTKEMLEFFDRSRERMDVGVSQSMQATQLANQLTMRPSLVERREFAPFGTITAGQAIEQEANENINEYNARVARLNRMMEAIRIQTNAAIGAASNAPNYASLLTPAFTAFNAIMSDREQQKKRKDMEERLKTA